MSDRVERRAPRSPELEPPRSETPLSDASRRLLRLSTVLEGAALLLLAEQCEETRLAILAAHEGDAVLHAHHATSAHRIAAVLDPLVAHSVDYMRPHAGTYPRRVAPLETSAEEEP